MLVIRYYKILKEGKIDGLKAVDEYKLSEEGKLVSCFETYVSYDKNHIKLCLTSEKQWIEITYIECCDILKNTGWGVSHKQEVIPSS